MENLEYTQNLSDKIANLTISTDAISNNIINLPSRIKSGIPEISAIKLSSEDTLEANRKIAIDADQQRMHLDKIEAAINEQSGFLSKIHTEIAEEDVLNQKNRITFNQLEKDSEEANRHREKLVEVMSETSEGIANLGEGLEGGKEKGFLGSILGSIGSFIMSPFKSLGGLASKVFKGPMKLLSGLGRLLLKPLKLFKGLGAFLLKPLKLIGKVFSPILKILKPLTKFAGPLLNAAKGIPGVGLAITAVMGLIDAFSALGNVEEITGKAKENITMLDNALVMVSGFISGLTFGLLDTKTVFEGLNDFSLKVKEFFSGVIDFVPRLWGALTETIPQMIEDAKRVFQERGFIGLISDLVVGIKDYVTYFWGKIIDWVKGLDFKQIWESVKSGASSMMKGAAEGASSLWEGTKGFLFGEKKSLSESITGGEGSIFTDAAKRTTEKVKESYDIDKTKKFMEEKEGYKPFPVEYLKKEPAISPVKEEPKKTIEERASNIIPTKEEPKRVTIEERASNVIPIREDIELEEHKVVKTRTREITRQEFEKRRMYNRDRTSKFYPRPESSSNLDMSTEKLLAKEKKPVVEKEPKIIIQQPSPEAGSPSVPKTVRIDDKGLDFVSYALAD